MSEKNTAVFGIYSSYAHCRKRCRRLKAAGFSNRDISVSFPRARDAGFRARERYEGSRGRCSRREYGRRFSGAMGWLVGVGALAIPGWTFIAAGPIYGRPCCAGVAGTVLGVAGALVGLGIPEYEAKRYEGRMKDGGILLSVHSDSSDWTKRAKLILEATGAQDISSTSEAKSSGEKAELPRAS